MKLRFSHKLIAIIAAAAASMTINAATHSVKATLDSAYLLMGRQTRLHLEIVEDKDASGQLLLKGDTLVKEVEVIDMSQADTTDIGNNRVQINRNLIIQSFDSGLYTLPPILYVSNGDTSESRQLTLKVLPAPVDSLATIHAYAGIEEGESRWYDFLPNWITDYWGWILLAIILIAGGIVAYLLTTKKVRNVILPAKKPIPPYELAMIQLNALREQHLCENGQEREYYTQLTEILRDYLARRFGINAMEMTSSQIVSTLAANEATKLPNRFMKQILEIADFVKFAKVRPLPDDNAKSFNSAIQFIEDTRPEPETETESDKTDDTNETQKTKINLTKKQ